VAPTGLAGCWRRSVDPGDAATTRVCHRHTSLPNKLGVRRCWRRVRPRPADYHSPQHAEHDALPIRCGSRGATPRGQQEPALTVIRLDGVTDDRAASGAFVPSLWLVRNRWSTVDTRCCFKTRCSREDGTVYGGRTERDYQRDPLWGGEPCHTVRPAPSWLADLAITVLARAA
jgi:hypothetical protein